MNRKGKARLNLTTTMLLLGHLLAWPQRIHANDASETLCLAQAMYWEARSGGPEAMIAIGWVVLNRKQHAEFPDTICSVVRQGGEDPPCQFSFWCDGVSETPDNDELWATARNLTDRMLRDPPEDPTGGALYFHSVRIPEPWAEPRQRLVRIGGHIFYR